MRLNSWLLYCKNGVKSKICRASSTPCRHLWGSRPRAFEDVSATGLRQILPLWMICRPPWWCQSNPVRSCRPMLRICVLLQHGAERLRFAPLCSCGNDLYESGPFGHGVGLNFLVLMQQGLNVALVGRADITSRCDNGHAVLQIRI
jgi:hypothetical protein